MSSLANSPSLEDCSKAIAVEPYKRGGDPCVRCLRITVQDVLDYLASGLTPSKVVADFPDLIEEDLRASLAFAADRDPRLMPCSSLASFGHLELVERHGASLDAGAVALGAALSEPDSVKWGLDDVVRAQALPVLGLEAEVGE